MNDRLRPINCYEDPTTGDSNCVPAYFDPQTVIKYRVMEDWIWDEQHGKMVARIMGIAPVREVINPATGTVRGEEYLFWVFYPEARLVLAKNRAFNPGNDAIAYSWDDIFESRMFSSYVVKESNVLDRSIEAYATGIRAVLESKRIEDKLFKMEHNMWEH